MTEISRQLMFGQSPVHRSNPTSGQSEWYYIDPRYGDDDPRRQIDVPSEFTPNPRAGEIQNHLYNSDKFSYEQLYGNTAPPSLKQSNTFAQNDPNCYMTFDGQNLNLYNNTGLVNTLDAQSGRDEYQSAKYQNLADRGPLPEGTYYANQDQRQNITLFDMAAGIVNHGAWPGTLPAWGTKRVWLQPDANTNTYGRSGFTIHGGWSKGSAGCIDIPWQTGKLSDYLDNCQYSVPVYTKYPKNW